MKSKVTRIPTELDQAIINISKKNNINYSDAARELAKLNERIKNKGRVFKEIKF